MNTKLIGVIIAASVAILMSGSILLPVINDAVDDTKIYYNNSLGSYSMINDGSDIEFSIVPTGNTSGVVHNIVIDGEIRANLYSGYVRSLVISDKFVISQTDARLLAFAHVIDGVPHNLTFESGTTLTVSLSDYVATVSNGTDTYTVPFDWCFYRDNKSTSYRTIDFSDSESVIYINDVNQVYASNWIFATGEFFAINGTNVTIYGENEDTTASYDGLTEVMNGVSSFNVGHIAGGVRTAGIHFSVLDDGADYEVYPYFIVVPASVYGQTETNESYTALLYAIPVVLLTAIVATIAMMFARRY